MLNLPTPVVIVGLGKTGLACLRFLKKHQQKVTVIDSRKKPPMLAEAVSEFPDTEIFCGTFDLPLVETAATIIISPGVSIHQEIFQKALNNGAEIIGDVELFAIENTTDVIAITGSNGKTTVTTLVEILLKAIGKNIAVGGNIGTPCLQLLSKSKLDFVVLELSSFQLETTKSLHPVSATVLNISPDHLDRYQSMEHYKNTKLSIFKADSIAIIPLEQNWDLPLVENTRTFSVKKLADYSVIEHQNQQWVSVAGVPWMAISELKLLGHHNLLNVLAALALIDCAGVNIFASNQKPLITALKKFKGLPHRCEVVARKNTVLWVNDSKATNVASTSAAIESYAEGFSEKIILIAGGDSKNADLSSLQKILVQHVYKLITFGQDGHKISELMTETGRTLAVSDLQSAVIEAEKMAPENGLVLFSPACSSLDMFTSYEARGESFIEAVEALAA